MQNPFKDIDLNTSLLLVNDQLAVLGDPHIGRVFKTGVPLDRKGDHEAIVNDTFLQCLTQFPETTKYHICVGDLFDSFRQPEEIILFVARAYQQAANDNPNVAYIVLAGNHDLSRHADKASAFDILAEILAPIPNICIVKTPTVLGTGDDTIGIVPWSPFRNSQQQAQLMVDQVTTDKPQFVFGHWDFIDFSMEEQGGDNVIPYETLTPLCKNVITGHYHKKGIHSLANGFQVLVTGSMLPYAHGEDIFDQHYQTLTPEQLRAQLSEFGEDHFKDVVLRIELQEGESPVEGVNCLSLTHKRINKKGSAELEVNVDAFSLEAVFRNACHEQDVTDELMDNLWQRIAERNV